MTKLAAALALISAVSMAQKLSITTMHSGKDCISKPLTAMAMADSQRSGSCEPGPCQPWKSYSAKSQCVSGDTQTALGKVMSPDPYWTLTVTEDSSLCKDGKLPPSSQSTIHAVALSDACIPGISSFKATADALTFCASESCNLDCITLKHNECTRHTGFYMRATFNPKGAQAVAGDGQVKSPADNIGLSGAIGVAVLAVALFLV